MTGDLNTELADQLDLHWHHHLRPRFDGLTDDEYPGEPVAGCWSVRRRSEAEARLAHGSGDFVMEYRSPEPTPPPVTTIAWRFAHITVGCLGARTAAHFGGPPCDWDGFGYASGAAEAVRQIDEAWVFSMTTTRDRTGSSSTTRSNTPSGSRTGRYPVVGVRRAPKAAGTSASTTSNGSGPTCAR